MASGRVGALRMDLELGFGLGVMGVKIGASGLSSLISLMGCRNFTLLFVVGPVFTCSPHVPGCVERSSLTLELN